MTKTTGLLVLGLFTAVLAVVTAFMNFTLISVALFAIAVCTVLVLVWLVHRFLVKSQHRNAAQLLEIRKDVSEMGISAKDYGERAAEISDYPNSSSSESGYSKENQNRSESKSRSENQHPSKKQGSTNPSTNRLEAPALTPISSVGLSYIYKFTKMVQDEPALAERLALRTKSLEIRDSFALAGTGGYLPFKELVTVTRAVLDGDSDVESRIGGWNWQILLMLARIISNQRFSKRDILAADEIFTLTLGIKGIGEFQAKDVKIFAEVKQLLGEFKAAVELLDLAEIGKKEPEQVTFSQANAIAALQGKTDVWESIVSRSFMRRGLEPVGFPTNVDRRDLDTLETLGAPIRSVEGPLISVLIPTHEGAKFIGTALRSVAFQTWKNLEIIVVDDGSSRENITALRQVCAEFQDVKLVELESNQGAYSARNRGLALARGEFITVHDDDDWSHARKLEIQAQYLLAHSDIPACASRHARVTPNLFFTRNNSNPSFVQSNFSSLMFRRSVFKQLGDWDEANRGADEELKKRITDVAGQTIATICPIPLSFTRTHDASLTSNEISRGYQDPGRGLYHAAFVRNHSKMKKRKSLRLRSFKRPLSFNPGMRGKNLGTFDYAVILDGSFRDELSMVALEQLKLAADNGYRTALIPVASAIAGGRPLSDEVLELGDETDIELLSLNDEADISYLQVVHPRTLLFLENHGSKLSAKRTEMILNETAAAALQPFDESETKKLVSNAKILFGAKPTIAEWSSFTGTDQNLAFGYIGTTVGNTLGSQSFSKRPVVGHHGIGMTYEWPDKRSDLELFYQRSDVFDVKVYGPVNHLSEKARSLLNESATLVGNSATTLESFLESVDFWVHYPTHGGTVFEKSVIEAVNSGKVVILPKELKNLYGNRALYMSRKAFRGSIERIWENPFLYRDQVERSIRLVNYLAKDQFLEALRSVCATQPSESEKQS